MAGALGPTVLDLITEIFGILNVYAQGEPIDAADSMSALFTIQAMVDGWGTEALTIIGTLPLAVAATAGKQAYVAGPAALGVDWVLPFLPPEIDAMGMQYGAVTPVLEREIEVIGTAEWEAIELKGLSSSIVERCWPQYGVTSHTLNLHPIPNQTIPVILYLQQALGKFTALNNVLVLGPGYQEALTYEGVLKLAAKFGKAIPQWVPEAWADAKQKIKAANFEALYQRVDPALTGSGRRGGGSIRFYEGK